MSNWEDELDWYYHCADGELGVRGVGFETSGVATPPHERASPARDSKPGEETAAEKDARIRSTLALVPHWSSRILQRYYQWNPGRARLTIQERRNEEIEKVRLAHVGKLVERGPKKKPTRSDVVRVVDNAHADYRAARKVWRDRAKAEREAKRRADLAYLRGEAVVR